MDIKAIHRATCHCGRVELALSLPDGLVDPRRCSCSMCRRRGTIVASVPLDAIRIVKGEEFLRLYQFNIMTAKLPSRLRFGVMQKCDSHL